MPASYFDLSPDEDNAQVCESQMQADRQHLPRGIYRCARGRTQPPGTSLPKVCWRLQLTLRETVLPRQPEAKGAQQTSLASLAQSSLGSQNLIKDPSASPIARRLWDEKELTLTLLPVSLGSQEDLPVEDPLFNLVKVNGSRGLSLPPSVVHCPDYPLGTPGELLKNVNACGAPGPEILI